MKPKLKIRHSAPVPSVGLRCSVYARKSSAEEPTKSAEHKSVARQVEHARKFIAEKGWTVSEHHIFEDDAYSGADFFNRPGLTSLLASVPKRGQPPFDVLVMSEPSRLGRDMNRTTGVVIDLIEAGVRIFYYLDGTEEKADTPEAKFMLAAKGYAAESERARTGQRVRDTLLKRADAGECAGGRVFGYDNIWLMPGGKRYKAKPGESKGGQKFSTVYSINKGEAEITRKIFDLYRLGWGHSCIAQILNASPRYKAENQKYFGGVRPPSPRGGKRTGSWAPSSVRQILVNPRYRGLIPFGKMRRVYRGGRPRRQIVGKANFVERPKLLIIDDSLWNAVQKRVAAARKCYIREQGGTLWGRPESGKHSRYLLSGLARCGGCGSSIIGKANGSGVPWYVCSYASKRGPSVCRNNVRVRQDVVDEEFIRKIERALTPKRIEDALQVGVRLSRDQRKKEPDRVGILTAELKKLERERGNLVSAIKGRTNPPEIVLEEIDKMALAIRDKKAQVDALPNPTTATAHLSLLKAGMADRMRRFPELMRADPVQARQALRKLLDDGKGKVQPLKCVIVEGKNGKRSFDFQSDGAWLGALLNPSGEVHGTPRRL